MEKSTLSVISDHIEYATQMGEILRIRHDLSAGLNSVSDLNDALELILRACFQSGAVDCGGVYILQPFSQDLVLEMEIGLPEYFVKNAGRFNRGSGQANLIVEGELVYPLYPALLPDLRRRDYHRHMLRFAAIFPVKHRQEVIAALYLASHYYDEISPPAFEFLEGIAAEAGNVIARINAEKEVQALSNRLLEVQELERRALARDLHDEIGQILTGLNFTLETVNRTSPTSSKSALKKAQEMTRTLITKVRNMSLNLRPSILDDMGLLVALQWQFERFTSSTGIAVHFDTSGLEAKRFNFEIETAAYRIIQEAITNAARHAHAPEIYVSVKVIDRQLALSIYDNGAGFDPEQLPKTAHSTGLSSIRERTMLLQGKCAIHSKPGKGTQISIELPI